MTINEVTDFWYCYSRLLIFFKGDRNKVTAWLKIKNPNFGYISPEYLFTRNRGIRVRQFIEAALED